MASWQLLSNIYSNVRYNAQKDSNTLTDADLLILSNKYFYKIFRELADTNEDIYSEISAASLVANQAEYALPTDSATTPFAGGLIKLLRVEVSHDGSNWYTARPMDLTNRADPIIFDSSAGPTVASVNQDYSTTDPRYAYFDRSVWIYPIPTTARTNALRIFWLKHPNEMTASTDIPELPKNFLDILSEGILIDVYRKYGRISDSDRARLNFNQMLQRAKALEVQTDEPIVLRPVGNYSDYD